jgi:hypothetical protein
VKISCVAPYRRSVGDESEKEAALPDPAERESGLLDQTTDTS